MATERVMIPPESTSDKLWGSSSPKGNSSTQRPYAGLPGALPEIWRQSPRTALLGLESIGSPQKLEIWLAASMLMCWGGVKREGFPEHPSESAAPFGMNPEHVPTKGSTLQIEI